MNEQENGVLNRVAMTRALAVVGFIALIVASMWLAVYSSRFVPSVAGRLGAAAVYLGSVFIPKEPSLSVIPVASSTIISFDNTSTTTATSTGSVSAAPAPEKTIVPAPGKTATSTYQINGATTTPSLRGLPDFVVRINAVGYLATSSAESFVASTTVPSGRRAAVSFTIENVGANISGPWRFSASIPTQTNFLFISQAQQSLAPGDRIDYTLGFDQATPGADKMISITANFDRAIEESNANNNSASAKVTVIGS